MDREDYIVAEDIVNPGNRRWEIDIDDYGFDMRGDLMDQKGELADNII